MADYTGLDIIRVTELDILDFWGYLHDAVIWSCMKTEAGREYLENAYYYQQTEPDRNALRLLTGGRENGE